MSENRISPRQLLLRVSLSAGPLAGPPGSGSPARAVRPAALQAALRSQGLRFRPSQDKSIQKLQTPIRKPIERAPEGWKGGGGEDGLDLLAKT
jgi:hypothetical protein